MSPVEHFWADEQNEIPLFMRVKSVSCGGGRKTIKLRLRTPLWQCLAAWNRRASRSGPDPRDFERQVAGPAQDRATAGGGRGPSERGGAPAPAGVVSHA